MNALYYKAQLQANQERKALAKHVCMKNGWQNILQESKIKCVASLGETSRVLTLLQMIYCQGPRFLYEKPDICCKLAYVLLILLNLLWVCAELGMVCMVERWELRKGLQKHNANSGQGGGAVRR